jgi:hypothetical protein
MPLGAVCLFCHYNALDWHNALFSYLCTDQDDTLKAFKHRHLTAATGKPLFSATQLANFTLLLPADEGNLSPIQLDDEETQTQGYIVTAI